MNHLSLNVMPMFSRRQFSVIRVEEAGAFLTHWNDTLTRERLLTLLVTGNPKPAVRLYSLGPLCPFTL